MLVNASVSLLKSFKKIFSFFLFEKREMEIEYLTFVKYY